jgi:hypothetical protein
VITIVAERRGTGAYTMFAFARELRYEAKGA